MRRIKNRFFIRAYIRAVAAFIIILIGYLGLSVYFIKTQSEQTAEIRKNEIRRLVNTAYNLVYPYIEKFNAGKISAEEALLEIRNTIRKMTYEDSFGKNYLFMSSFSGTMLVQPFEREKEGSNQWDLVDQNGIYIIRELVKTASSPEGKGFVTYHYYNPAYGRVMEKMSYVIGIRELGCYLGVGLYMDDIKSQWISYTLNSLLLAFLLLSAVFLLVGGIIRPVLRTSEILMNYFDAAADSPDTMKPVVSGRFGRNMYTSFMIGGFNKMIERIADYGRMLAGSEEKFRSFFANSADAILFVSPDGKILEANRSSLEVFGYEGGSITGMDFSSFFMERENAEKMISRLSAARYLKNLEEKMVRKDGRLIDTLITAMLSSGRTGGEVTLYFIIRDITASRELEKQLVQTQKMETIGSLAGGVAHDFNNYLGAITGSVSLLRFEYEKNGFVTTERFGKIAGILEDACGNASKMITQLQSVSGRYSEEFTVRDLNLIAGQVADICRNTIDKSVSIKLVKSEKKALVFGDSRIEQVILNICINAAHAMTIMRKAGSPWGGVLTITVERAEIKPWSNLITRYGASEGSYEVVSVRDTGVGIDLPQIDKVFDPFYTTKPKGQGTGLGLAMAYRTASQHKGFITVESEPESGSVFSFYIPSHSGDSFAGRRGQKGLRQLSGNVLVIDDEGTFREALSDMLRAIGLDVNAVSSASEGIDFLKKKEKDIDLVMLDVAMPGISGTEAYPLIKAINPGIKILLTSGYGSDPRIENIIKSGIDGFIQKPYTLERLYEKIKNILQE